MTQGRITLSIGTMTLTLGVPSVTPWSESSYPRERIDGPQFSRSAFGSVIQEGTFYTPPHSWSLGFRCRTADRQKIKRMYDYWLENGGYVRIDDEVEPVNETTRTRALVPSTTETTVDGMVEYYSRFDAYFVAEPKFSQDGAWITVSCQFTEGTKVAP